MGGGGLFPPCWDGVGEGGGGGLLVPCCEGVGEAGGGAGAGPLVGVWPPGEGADLLLPRELWRCGSSGADSIPPLPAGPLATR